ncbi:MAG: hypothetical protein ACOC8B_01960 [Gemmatimonadota bacterium]
MNATTATTDERAETGARSAEAGRAGRDFGVPGWLPPLAFAAVTMLLFREFIFSQAMLYGSDTIALGYFARDFYAHAVSALGTFPLWNPYLFGGLPFVDAMHGDVFYPTSLLLFFMETHRALGWKLVLHVFLAGAFTYVWLRRIGAGRAGALFGGLVYMLGAFLVSLVYPGHDGKLFVTALTPLVFWLAERAVTERGPAEFAWFAIGIALLLFTAHMQLAYFAVWGVSLYFLFRLGQVWRAERRTGEVARLFGLFALAGVLGAGAAAIQLVPPFLYLRESSHRVERTVEAEGESGYEYSTSWSMHPEEAVSLVVPEFAGVNIQDGEEANNTYWGRNPFRLNHIYAGLIPLLLIPLLLLGRWRGRDAFFLLLAALALLYALGDTTPAFRVFYTLVPGVSLFRAPDSIMFLFGFAVATLGAFGLERFLALARDEGSDGRRRAARVWLWSATAGLGLLALLASSGALIDAWRAVVYPAIEPGKLMALRGNLPNIERGFWTAALLAGLVAGTWELVSRGVAGRRLALIAVVLLAVVDLWRVDHRFIVTRDADQFFSRPLAVRHLENLQAEGEIFRVMDLGAFPSNLAAIHGIEQLGGHHGNELGRYRALVGGEQLANVAASELRLLDLLNVRYLITQQPIQAPGFRESFRGESALVYRNENALPRAFLVGRVEVAGDAAAVDRLLSAGFDFRTTALLPEPLPDGVRIEPDPSGTVDWVRRDLNEHTLRVTSDRPALLVISDNYYEAWRAEVDGQRAPLLRADHTLRAVPVPAGTHTVELEYRSDVLRASAAASVALLLGLLAIGASPAVLGIVRPDDDDDAS